MLRRFAADKRGSFAAAVALSFVAVLGAVSASLDYSRMTNSRAALASAVDAAALAAAQATTSEMKTTARNVFDANFRESDTVTSFKAVAIKQGLSEAVRVEATADVKMTLAQTIGFSRLPVRAVTEVVVGNDADMQVALVLDVTGSMAGAKLAALKSATTDMINTLYDKLSQGNRIKMAVAPFAEYVNVGISNRTQPWMSVPNDSSSTQEVCWQTRDVVRTYDCRTETYTWNSCNDGLCTTQSGTRNVCSHDYGPYYQKCGNQTTSSKWYGCAGSRSYPFNVRDENYTIYPVPGVMNVSCPPQLTTLSSQRSTVLNAISALAAGGETYIPSGLMWGWAALSLIEPF